MDDLSPPPILLASQSPRRRRLLSWLGVCFEATEVDTPEDLDSPLASDPRALAESLAAEKAEAARETDPRASALVLCFDTIVAHDGRLLGKPADDADAWRMLRELSGATHQVVTGCALVCPGDSEPATFSVVTDVTMHRLGDERIAEWMSGGTYAGCAGAYNIEAQVADVTADQCYQNVAGLPLCHLHAALRALPAGCAPRGLVEPVARCDRELQRLCRLGPLLMD
jgi:septum formation protein